jgi:hypothetical protein
MRNISRLRKVRKSDNFCRVFGHQSQPGNVAADATLWTSSRSVCYAAFCLTDKKYCLARGTRGCGLISCRCWCDCPLAGGGGGRSWSFGCGSVTLGFALVNLLSGERVSVCSCCGALPALSHTPVECQCCEEAHRTTKVHGTSHDILGDGRCKVFIFFGIRYHYRAIEVHLTFEILF